MNKTELINAISLDAELPKPQVERTVNTLLEKISDELARGGEVALLGFGTFTVKERPARTGRNPKTGEPMQISASKAPNFKAGAKLKASVGLS
ncbi:HU family DNA-binding protein [Pseudomonas sp. o96-267]|uniref:HU family DNA-binding protein n=1 Tax=Pseudomonas sp. o96-267 TaxID=2479853 RepID=UPI000F7B42E7|nr:MULTISPECIES: HU family DNA-binding protein [Pseudomonas]MDH0959108.1 HU family DNA-binding protein [Pseudomonas chengduensis]MDV5863584.1 HU family DNA-binding protein [Pseudomonas mendocina]RRV31697.1 HU family DNA-binding protein [Pseudomonas sp. o96-267]